MKEEIYVFISYRLEDEKWAKWLQNMLEHYRFPESLNGRRDLPKEILPTFRYVTGRKPGLLSEEIGNALHNSQWLIVVCSPRGEKSPWVCKEAQTFIDLGRADHIIPFVIEGIPFSCDSATECYPEALLNLTGSKELLSANVSEMGRDAAVVKVVACMLNLSFDSIWPTCEREQKRKRWIWMGVFILIALFGLCIGGYPARQNTTITRQKSQLENTTDNALVDDWSMMVNQERVVAKQMDSLIEEGDLYTALLIGKELLTQKDRPHVPQIEKAFRRAYDRICSPKLHPVSVLKYTGPEPYGIGRPAVVSFSCDSKYFQVAYDWELDGIGRTICEYCALTGELKKEKRVDTICKDSMNIIGYEECKVVNNEGEVFWSPDKSYMLKVYHDRCIIYKKGKSLNYKKYPVGVCGNICKNSTTKDSKYAIFGDGIYRLLSGKKVRTLASSSDWTVFSPDDRYIISMSDGVISVADVHTSKILHRIGISRNAMAPLLDGNGDLYVPVWKDSFYVYKIPSLEIIDKGLVKTKEKEFYIDIQGRDIVLYRNGKKVQNMKNILPEEPLHEEHVNFEMIDNNRKILVTYISKCMLWDLKKGRLLKKWSYGKDRYCGVRYSNDKKLMLAYNGFRIRIYDTNTGLLLWDRTPAEKCLSYDDFGATFSSDERYIIHYISSHGGPDCDNDWNSMIYVYEFLPIDELIQKCHDYIGNRKLSQKERTEFCLN